MTSYDQDIIAWAREQAALLRAGRFEEIDVKHIADEIEDVARDEVRDMTHRIASLTVWLLRWKYQELRSPSLHSMIRVQRERLKAQLRGTPSPKLSLADDEWIKDVWADARQQASRETSIGFAFLPERCPWAMEQGLDPMFWPDQGRRAQ
ncbi:hypothetical protein PPGU19_086590 (plasmid) [Paraburkholderia sp. PGU19]|uniref:DUF29 domain-containing protein n=1 Tax=Paraburkholderia sp. PGU19 TaxID=2735434 RepID=UPI0015DA3133|nr:DUF29 domain-containing protein [Paraburkholderia sp. PGU19]BCG04091.1 hypothetical protein PPGU19_086590 [Paraburkholderia sp. PGU19]